MGAALVGKLEKFRPAPQAHHPRSFNSTACSMVSPVSLARLRYGPVEITDRSAQTPLPHFAIERGPSFRRDPVIATMSAHQFLEIGRTHFAL